MNLDERKLQTLMLNIKDYMAGKDNNLFKNRYNVRVGENRMRQLSNVITFYYNNYFTPKQMMLYVCYNLFFHDGFNMTLKWDFKHVSDIDKVFSAEQLKQDKNLIETLCEKYKVDLDYFLTINNSGEMIALELVRQKKISPIFVIRFKDRIVQNSKPSDDTERMLRIVSALESILKTELLKKDT